MAFVGATMINVFDMVFAAALLLIIWIMPCAIDHVWPDKSPYSEYACPFCWFGKLKKKMK